MMKEGCPIHFQSGRHLKTVGEALLKFFWFFSFKKRTEKEYIRNRPQHMFRSENRKHVQYAHAFVFIYGIKRSDDSAYVLSFFFLERL